MAKEITANEETGRISSNKLEQEAEATEKADGAKIRKKNSKKTIQELREETKSYTHEFDQPFTYNGNTVEKLTFHWYTLTGRDSIAIERELAADSGGRGAQNYSREHMALIAVHACSERGSNDIRIVNKDFMNALPIVDFEEITAMGRLFFRLWGLI